MKKICLLVLGGFILAGCNPKPPATDKKAQLAALQDQQQKLNQQIQKLQTDLAATDTAASANIKEVNVSPVSLKPFTHYINTQALVTSDKNISVVPQTQGIYLAIYVKEGQVVSNGQALAKVDDQVLQRNLAQAQTTLNLNKVLYDKRKRLWDQKIGTEVDYLQSETNMKTSQDQVALIRQQIAQTIVRSPVSGTVDMVNARLGEAASPAAPAFRIVNTDVLKVVAGLSENYLGRVKIGSPLSLSFNDIGLKLNTKVDFVGYTLDQNARTFAVQAKLFHQKGVKPNMTADMKIQDFSTDKAVVLPVDVVQSTLNGNYVFIAEKKDEKSTIARKKTVQTGLTQDGNIQVVSGLNTGDQVITTGYRGLEDGQAISYK